MRHSVTTPGGFFIGLGGIALSLLVASAVFWIVKNPASSDELRPQQIALKLVPATTDVGTAATDIESKTKALLEAAAAKYNGGEKPDINELEQLRGVVRYQKSQESLVASAETLHAPSNVKGSDQKPLTVQEAAKRAVLVEIQAKKPVASAAKVDLNPPAEVIMSEQQLPNLQGGGARTVTFPEIKPPAPPAPAPGAVPAAAAAGAAAAGAAAATAPSPAKPPAASAPEPNRAPLLNGTEPTK